MTSYTNKEAGDAENREWIFNTCSFVYNLPQHVNLHMDLVNRGSSEMMRIVNTPADTEEKKLAEVTCKEAANSQTGEHSIATAMSHPHPTTQLLLSSKLLMHRPQAGLNPLVDAAAYLFSMMGKLKHIKSYQNLSALHEELVKEIEHFQETVERYSYHAAYISEYLPITCYALCVTLDDIISTTPWGQGKWDGYRLAVSFDQALLTHNNFLIILERLIRDPAIYIDVMEFLYICLSLGFKCHYHASPFSHEQLEQITNSLYKRIRAYRGNFSKILSPFAIKPHQHIPHSPVKKHLVWLSIMVVLGSCMAAFALGYYLLDRNMKGIYQHAITQHVTQTELASHEKQTA